MSERASEEVTAALHKAREDGHAQLCLVCLRGFTGEECPHPHLATHQQEPEGELTAERQLESLDPHGVLSLAVHLGEERAANLLRVRVQQVERDG